MTNDVLADTLTRIRNAVVRAHTEVELLSTATVKAILDIFKQEGFIDSYREIEIPVATKGKVQKRLVAKLKYLNKKPVISHLKRISKPGLRIYKSYQEIPKVLNGLGINVFSTSKGILTGREARAEKVGGEYLCEIW